MASRTGRGAGPHARRESDPLTLTRSHHGVTTCSKGPVIVVPCAGISTALRVRQPPAPCG